MGKYDHLSKEELIQRIERLEADLEKATLTPSASDNELEMRQSQAYDQLLKYLDGYDLVERICGDHGERYFQTVSGISILNKVGGGIYGGQGRKIS